MTHFRVSVFAACTALLILTTGCAPEGVPWPGLADASQADTGLSSGNPFEGYDSETYSDGDMWMCGPDASDDACGSADLDATIVSDDGSLRPVAHEPAAEPPVDCFYVYPTVELLAAPGNVRSLRDDEPMRSAVRKQAARLSEVCRVIAPLYHQATLASYAAPRRDAFLDRAYEDVEDAFMHYMAKHNQGRPLVLVGHSQGAHMIARLMQRQFDVHPVLREQLVVAMPIGAQLYVESGSTTGGSFSRVPICTDDNSAGCIIAFRSFAAGHPPTKEADDIPEEYHEICVNPAKVGRAAALSRSYFSTDGKAGADTPDEVETAYAMYPDFYRAECESNDDHHYLTLDVVADDTRDNPVNFDGGLSSGEMGLHIWDMHVALGDLIDNVERRSATVSGE